MRTANKLGVETVAVYSDADKHSKHVQIANNAYHIGPSPSAQSYLNANKLIEIAHKSGAQAIHPGFGFLSENADFAELVTKSGLIFVGPPASAIRSMGSKAESKKIMHEAKVPIVESYYGENQDPKFLLEQAKKIGFPVLIKAVSGGGGKGMKIVMNESEFLSQLESSKREALKSFNDDRVLIEKYITKPRHIEIQVFGDQFKNYVYLFERDCSVQRRHQKVIEEAPSNIGQQLREKIGMSAIDAAKAVGYYNAGTVEFIFDTETNKYYFMEMNTRLQVEHPVTEMITGQDLVEWQLLVASGKPLPKKQEELKINGHAIEVRIYSEDPYNNFFPGNGKLSYLREPVEEPGRVRLETSIRQGDEISIFYDPMISKLICWGQDRDAAIRKLDSALANYKIGGVVNNVSFLKTCLQQEDFIKFEYDTGFIAKNQDKLLVHSEKFDDNSLLSAVLSYVAENANPKLPQGFVNFRTNAPLTREYTFTAKLNQCSKDPVDYQAKVVGPYDNDLYDVTLTSAAGKQEFKGVSFTKFSNNFVNLSINHQNILKEIVPHNKKYTVFEESGESVEIVFDETQHRPVDMASYHERMSASSQMASSSGDDSRHKAKGAGGDKNSIRAPMPGTLVKVLVKEGEKIASGAAVIVMEAMKMEHTIKAPRDVIIKKIHYKEGNFIDIGEAIVSFE